MRDIKFRVWDKEYNFMDYRVRVNSVQPTFNNFDNKYLCYVEVLDAFTSWREVTDYELMQSTNLKDNNGVEIWDGDIVEYRDGEYSFIGVMARTVLGLYVWGTYDNIDIDDVASDADNRADLVVLGNIYENPELLDDAETDC